MPSGYIHWREALTLYSLEGMTALHTDELPKKPTLSEFELEAYYHELADYEPNPKIQRLIQDSLGQS